MSPRRGGVAIIGGGIGGLTAAVALARRGVPCTVYEAAPVLAPVGAGILLPPNAMEVMRRLELREAVEASGEPLESMELHSLRSGLLQRGDMHGMGRTHDLTAVAIHRAKLHEILRGALPPGTVRVDSRVESVEDEPEQVVLRLAGGGTGTAAVAIAADGLWSATRTACFPAAQPRPAGQTAWRGVVTGVPVQRGTGREIWGPDGRFGYAGIGESQVYWFAVVTSPPGARRGVQDRADLLRTLAARFPAPVSALVEATAPQRIIETDLFDLAPLSSWHRGRVVLLGDAAHATTPNLGQGGAQAIEDGYVLGMRLGEDRGLSAVFREYEERRMVKAAWVVKRSRAFGRVAHLSGGPTIAIRDAFLRMIPEGVARSQMASLYDPPLD